MSTVDRARVAVEYQAVCNHGYPYHAVCAGCGYRSIGYAAEHAARTIGEDHTCAARILVGDTVVTRYASDTTRELWTGTVTAVDTATQTVWVDYGWHRADHYAAALQVIA